MSVVPVRQASAESCRCPRTLSLMVMCHQHRRRHLHHPLLSQHRHLRLRHQAMSASSLRQQVIACPRHRMAFLAPGAILEASSTASASAWTQAMTVVALTRLRRQRQVASTTTVRRLASLMRSLALWRKVAAGSARHLAMPTAAAPWTWTRAAAIHSRSASSRTRVAGSIAVSCAGTATATAPAAPNAPRMSVSTQASPRGDSPPSRSMWSSEALSPLQSKNFVPGCSISCYACKANFFGFLQGPCGHLFQ